VSHLEHALKVLLDDRQVARTLPSPHFVLAPHVGKYTIPVVGSLWSRLKAWPPERWTLLVDSLQREGCHLVTLGAAGQTALPGTTGLIDLPIRQVAGVIERAKLLITVESGLWFVAAALGTPFVITPWWLPRSIDWAAPMNERRRGLSVFLHGTARWLRQATIQTVLLVVIALGLLAYVASVAAAERDAALECRAANLGTYPRPHGAVPGRQCPCLARASSAAGDGHCLEAAGRSIRGR